MVLFSFDDINQRAPFSRRFLWKDTLPLESFTLVRAIIILNMKKYGEIIGTRYFYEIY